MPQASRQLLERYYAAFNAGDWAGFVDLLTEHVAHDIRDGKAARVSNYYNLQDWLRQVGA